MTLRLRVGLALVALVTLTVAISGVLVQPTMVRPIADELLQNRIERTIRAAEAVEAGAPLPEVERRLGLELRREVGAPDEPPRPPPRPPGRGCGGGPPGRPGGTDWVRAEHTERPVWYRARHRVEVAARADDAWVVSHHVDGVRDLWQRLAASLLLAAVTLGAIATWLASRLLRPVEAAQLAMERIAGGDLAHRLDEGDGPEELRQVARAFNHMAEEVQRLMQSERQLMAGLSHELRTPLTRMRLQLELARRGRLDADGLEELDADVVELDGLLEELLELSRLEAGQAPVRRAPTDLRALIADLDPDVSVEGEGAADVDPRLLRRAVGNLIANARRHAPGAAVRVIVAPHRVVVEDDGPGVSEAQRAHLFEAFWQGDSGQGHGLGLAIVRRIARLHGGDARAEDAEPGLRVVLELPG